MSLQVLHIAEEIYQVRMEVEWGDVDGERDRKKGPGRDSTAFVSFLFIFLREKMP